MPVGSVVPTSDGNYSVTLRNGQKVVVSPPQLRQIIALAQQPSEDSYIPSIQPQPAEEKKSGIGLLGWAAIGTAAFFGWKYRGAIKSFLGFAEKGAPAAAKKIETALALREGSVLRPKVENLPTISGSLETLGLSKDVPLTKKGINNAIITLRNNNLSNPNFDIEQAILARKQLLTLVKDQGKVSKEIASSVTIAEKKPQLLLNAPKAAMSEIEKTTIQLEKDVISHNDSLASLKSELKAQGFDISDLDKLCETVCNDSSVSTVIKDKIFQVNRISDKLNNLNALKEGLANGENPVVVHNLYHNLSSRHDPASTVQYRFDGAQKKVISGFLVN